MGRPTKRKVPGGGNPAKAAQAKAASSSQSSRYTPPVPQSVKVSPPWVPVVMFVLLGVGLAVILLNYVGLLPGATSNWYLVVGLGFILSGIMTATQWH